MTNKITRCTAGHDDYANLSVARESVQRLGERVAHLLVEIDARCAAQCNDRNSIGYSCRQNIGVHRGPPELQGFLFRMSLLQGASAGPNVALPPGSLTPLMGNVSA